MADNQESGTSRSACGSGANSGSGWFPQQPKTGSDRTKTLLRVAPSSKRGGGSGGFGGRHRGSLLKRRASKTTGSAGLADQQQQQQQQQRQGTPGNNSRGSSFQCLLDTEDPETELQPELDEDFCTDEQAQMPPAHSQISCASTSYTSGSGFQLFGGHAGGQLQSSGSAAMQDVSASAILQQHQKQQQPSDQLDVSLLMHTGFYGTREDVEKLLAQAIQLHCRPNRQAEAPKLSEGWPNMQQPLQQHQQQQHQQRPRPKPTAASTHGLAEGLLQAWSCGGGGSSGKSVHFNVESSSNIDYSGAVAAQRDREWPMATMRDRLLLTDFSEEDIVEAEVEAEAVFLSAKPPVPKPRIERSVSLNRRGGQLTQSGSQSAGLRNFTAVASKQRGTIRPQPPPPPPTPQPTPTPRQRRSRQEEAVSLLRCLPPSPPPPQPQLLTVYPEGNQTAGHYPEEQASFSGELSVDGDAAAGATGGGGGGGGGSGGGGGNLIGGLGSFGGRCWLSHGGESSDEAGWSCHCFHFNPESTHGNPMLRYAQTLRLSRAPLSCIYSAITKHLYVLCFHPARNNSALLMMNLEVFHQERERVTSFVAKQMLPQKDDDEYKAAMEGINRRPVGPQGH